MPKRKRDLPAGAGGAEQAGALPFQEQELTFKLSLLPHAMEDMGGHVHARLNGLLMKYHEAAGGVLLALSNLRLPKERRFASVMGGLPFLHLHVQATALVFAPCPGLALEGRVIKVARTHVALLVHGLFNAAIAREDMGAGFAFHHPHDHGGTGAAYWVDESAEGEGTRMAVGDRVAFRVLRMHEAAGLIAMDGTLQAPAKAGDQGRDDEEEESSPAGAAAATNGKHKGKDKGERGEKKKKKHKKEEKRKG